MKVIWLEKCYNVYRMIFGRNSLPFVLGKKWVEFIDEIQLLWLNEADIRARYIVCIE